MDPNATLESLRLALHDYQEGANIGHDPDMLQAAERLAEHVADLDDWLSRGGLLPKEWTE